MWRLALETLGLDPALEGPSHEFTATQKVKELTPGNWVYDDDLTIHELDIICGVYRVDTGTYKPNISCDVNLLTLQ